jgi:hypothetical protein
MKVQIETDSYNERRYGKPYIALVDFSKNPKGACQWGDWVGQVGCEGLLVIDANPGDVVMHGQKDNRGNDSECRYAIVTEGGSLTHVTKPEAYKHSLKASSGKATPAQGQEVRNALSALLGALQGLQPAFAAGQGTLFDYENEVIEVEGAMDKAYEALNAKGGA